MTRNHRSITLVTPPGVEPVTLAELKLFARIDTDDEDSLLSDFIQAARTAAEQYTNRSFVTQTHRLTLDLGKSRAFDSLPAGVYDLPANAFDGALPSEINLPKGPLISVTSVVTYDINNSAATYASSNYLVSTANDRLTLNRDATWPSDLRPYSTCEVTFVAGYGASAESVPAPIRMAIKIHAANLYETRGMCGCDEPPDACKGMLRQYRIMGGF